MPFWELGMLAALGVVAGVLNVMAGGGSFLDLRVLIFLGLPAPLANGTNRVGILTQNLSGVIGFHGHGLFRWKSDLLLCAPALLGAVVGAIAALRLPDAAFTRLLSFAMVAVAIWMVAGNRPEQGRGAGAPSTPPALGSASLRAGGNRAKTLGNAGAIPQRSVAHRGSTNRHGNAGF